MNRRVIKCKRYDSRAELAEEWYELQEETGYGWFKEWITVEGASNVGGFVSWGPKKFHSKTEIKEFIRIADTGRASKTFREPIDNWEDE